MASTRRLAPILAADVVGYSRLMGVDEEGTLAALKVIRRDLADPKIKEHRGRIVKTTGDGLLLEFARVVDAMRCAVEVQREMAERNADVLPDRRIELRMGINVGDVIKDGRDIFGDGVNVAARLEALAEPGGICVSRVVRDQVRDKLAFSFEDMGERQVKNIARPVRVHRIVIGEGAGPSEPPTETSTKPPLALPEKPSIAVLPFANMSGDPEQEFFGDGITEDIITLLAGWRAFPVIARTSTFTYKGRTVDIRKVGEELGVRYIVEGSVRKSGRRVRVTAQLIQADTGHHIMAERCDRDLTDLFELQDEIATAIAGAIEPELFKFERERIAERPQLSGNAYELYQRGMWHHYRHTKEDNIEAQTFFRRALAIDAQYPQAAAALAIAVCNAAYLAWTEDAEGNYAESYELAQRAVALDARYPVARFALALVCAWTGRFDRSVVEYQETVNLNPSYAAAHVMLGSSFTYRGQPEKGVASVEKGIRLSPCDPRLFMWLPPLAAAHYQLGHYAEAVEIGRRSWTLNRNWPIGLTYVVAALAQLGQVEEAQAALADLKGLDPNLSLVQATLQRLYRDQAGIDHLLDGLRKAGMPEE
jgi:adenylate cyclase